MNMTASGTGFLPVLLDGRELDRIHGTGEHPSIENFRTMISFYYHFLHGY